MFGAVIVLIELGLFAVIVVDAVIVLINLALFVMNQNAKSKRVGIVFYVAHLNGKSPNYAVYMLSELRRLIRSVICCCVKAVIILIELSLFVVVVRVYVYTLLC